MDNSKENHTQQLEQSTPPKQSVQETHSKYGKNQKLENKTTTENNYHLRLKFTGVYSIIFLWFNNFFGFYNNCLMSFLPTSKQIPDFIFKDKLYSQESFCGNIELKSLFNSNQIKQSEISYVSFYPHTIAKELYLICDVDEVFNYTFSTAFFSSFIVNLLFLQYIDTHGRIKIFTLINKIVFIGVLQFFYLVSHYQLYFLATVFGINMLNDSIEVTMICENYDKNSAAKVFAYSSLGYSILGIITYTVMEYYQDYRIILTLIGISVFLNLVLTVLFVEETLEWVKANNYEKFLIVVDRIVSYEAVYKQLSRKEDEKVTKNSDQSNQCDDKEQRKPLLIHKEKQKELMMSSINNSKITEEEFDYLFELEYYNEALDKANDRKIDELVDAEFEQSTEINIEKQIERIEKKNSGKPKTTVIVLDRKREYSIFDLLRRSSLRLITIRVFFLSFTPMFITIIVFLNFSSLGIPVVTTACLCFLADFFAFLSSYKMKVIFGRKNGLFMNYLLITFVITLILLFDLSLLMKTLLVMVLVFSNSLCNSTRSHYINEAYPTNIKGHVAKFVIFSMIIGMLFGNYLLLLEVNTLKIGYLFTILCSGLSYSLPDTRFFTPGHLVKYSVHSNVDVIEDLI